MSKPIQIKKARGWEDLSGYPRFRTKTDDRREQSEYQRQLKPRVEALFDHYGIKAVDPDPWRALALALAREHVPGFQVVKAAGRPRKHTIGSISRLYRHYIRCRAEISAAMSPKRRSITDLQIVGRLKKDTTFREDFPDLADQSDKTLINHITGARTLRRDAVRALVRRAGHLRELHAHPGLEEELEELVGSVSAGDWSADAKGWGDLPGGEWSYADPSLWRKFRKTPGKP